MELFRVTAHDPRADEGQPGHPRYIYPLQTIGRWDNADIYRAIYLAHTPEGAIGEAFGNLASWGDAMFETPYLPSARRALVTFSAPDDLPLLDLDNADELAVRALRPSQIVIPNPPFTQAIAKMAYHEMAAPGKRRYSGITWWSRQYPGWSNVMLWFPIDVEPKLEVIAIDHLTMAHPAVVAAAKVLPRKAERDRF